MNLGTLLDAAVDIGQVQGGFVMTLGYLFTEKTKWNAQGTRLFNGTWEYKVPTACDIPVEFNVSLLKNSPNPNAFLPRRQGRRERGARVKFVFTEVLCVGPWWVLPIPSPRK